MVSLFLAISIPLLMGYFFVACLLPSQDASKSLYFVRCFLSIGIGFGFSSCVAFFLLRSVGLERAPLFVTEIAVIIILVALFFLYGSKARKEHIGIPQVSPKSVSVSGIQRTILILFFIALGLAVVIFAALSWKNPHGGWDAFAIWNLRARFLFRGGGHWTDAFSEHLSWSHLDYPLLLPANVARGWVVAGTNTVAVPIVLALLFTFGTIGLTVSSLAILRGESQGFLAGLVLLGTPYLIQIGASQLADVPLGFFFLSSLVLLSLRKKLIISEYRIIFLAGLSAGFAAWTKNEGLLFLLSTIVSLLVITFLSKDRRTCLKQIGYFSFGAAPVLLIAILFKLQLSPGNDLFSEMQIHTILARLTDPARHFTVLNALRREIGTFGGWPFNMPVFLLFYLLVCGLTKEVKFKEEVALPLITLSLMLGGYYLVYVLTPHNLIDHLQSSLDRLLTQLWASAIFVYFMIVLTLEEAVTIKEIQDPLGHSRCAE